MKERKQKTVLSKTQISSIDRSSTPLTLMGIHRGTNTFKINNALKERPYSAYGYSTGNNQRKWNGILTMVA